MTKAVPAKRYNSGCQQSQSTACLNLIAPVQEPTEQSLDDRDQVSNSSFESTQSILRGLDQDPDSTVGGSQSSVLSDRLVLDYNT